MLLKKFTIPFWALFLINFLLVTTGAAIAGDNETKKASVAFLPFQINAPKDLSYLKDGVRDMLASRLASRAGINNIGNLKVKDLLAGEEKIPTAEEVSSSLGTDYVVSGTITILGETLSVDVVVFSAATGNNESFFATAPKVSSLISAIDDLTWDIAVNVFSAEAPKVKTKAEASATLPDASQAATFQTAHPDRLFITPGIDPLTQPGGPSLGAKPFYHGITRSQELDFDIQAMAVGDVNGDGLDEVLLAQKTKVLVYQNNNGNLKEIGEISGDSRYTIISISTADLNGNGIAEVYVCAAGPRSTDSLAVEWNGEEFAYIYKNQGWYTRIIQYPGKGKIIIGQKYGADSLIEPGIFQLEIKEGELSLVTRLPIPERVNLNNFVLADLNNDSTLEVVAIDSNEDKLYIYNQEGKRLWSGGDHFGGVLRYIGGTEETGNYSERIYIPSGMIVTDINKDGRADIIVKKDSENSTRFGYIKTYPSGEIHALTWDGVALVPVWKTHKIEGYIADYALNADSELPVLYVGLKLKKEGLIFSSSYGEVDMIPVRGEE